MGMLSFLNAIILGVVEGITEFLPISSTGHLILTSSILKIKENEFIKSFEIIIQLGAILAVVFLYYKTLVKNFEVLKRIIIAFVPTGVIGLVLYKTVKTYLIGDEQIVLWSLFIGGIVLIIFEFFHKESQTTLKIENISYKHSVFIGLFQALAIIPGVSRSAATIIGGMLLKYPRKTVVEFSFLLAIPTMLAATTFDLVKNFSTFSSEQITFLSVGFIFSFITAVFAVRWFLRFIQSHTFTWFGVYRIAISILGFFII